MRAASAAVLLALAASSAAGEPILGFNLPVWWHDAYAAAPAQRGLEELAATGAGWVALTPTLYVRDRRDSEVAANERTADDDSLRAAIRRAKSLGLKVALKPHVDSLDGAARTWLAPKD